MTKSVLCVGRLYSDLIFSGTPRFPTPGTEVFAKSLTMHTGGGAFISAATLAALGHRVALLSYLPPEPFKSIVMNDLRAKDIDTKLCESVASGIDPQVTVAIVTDGDRAFLSRKSGPAVPKLNASELRRFDHVHIGELSTLQEYSDLLHAAKAEGLTVSADCSWQDQFDPAVNPLIELLDVFLPNEGEEAALTKVGIPADCARLTVVKCGPNGARAKANGGSAWLSACADPAQVVDTTGAGDAFNGGFLSAWLNGKPLKRCLELGNDMGHASVQAMGGTGGLYACPA